MDKYTVVVEEDEDGVFCVHVPALPGCRTQGKNIDDALKNAKEAILCYMESCEKDGLNTKAVHKVHIADVAV